MGFVGKPQADQGIVETIIGLATEGVKAVVRPEAVATVATTFTFPLLLVLAVLLFLLVQSRLDSRDPKLRSAPLTTDDALVSFEEDVE